MLIISCFPVEDGMGFVSIHKELLPDNILVDVLRSDTR